MSEAVSVSVLGSRERVFLSFGIPLSCLSLSHFRFVPICVFVLSLLALYPSLFLVYLSLSTSPSLL